MFLWFSQYRGVPWFSSPSTSKFFLEMTYNSNAIEGSRMTLKETEMALEGKKVRGKEIFEILETINHKNAS